jgi:hypothetical protein
MCLSIVPQPAMPNLAVLAGVQSLALMLVKLLLKIHPSIFGLA